jgi:hypothetical protein
MQSSTTASLNSLLELIHESLQELYYQKNEAELAGFYIMVS